MRVQALGPSFIPEFPVSATTIVTPHTITMPESLWIHSTSQYVRHVGSKYRLSRRHYGWIPLVGLGWLGLC